MKAKILVMTALCLLAAAGVSQAGGRCGWGGGGGWRGGGYCGPGYGWGGGPGWGWGGWGGPSFGISVVSAPVPVYRTVYVPVSTAPAYGGYSESIVAQSQVRLARLGYYKGDIDGDFGPRTNRAIQHFQVDNGLPVTGRLDRRTLASLGVGV